MLLKIVIFCLIIICSASMFFYVEHLDLNIFYTRDFIEENYDTQSILERFNYLERQEHTNQMCLLYKSPKTIDYQQTINDSILLDHILVDKRHKLLYCYVPKVACTNWKRVFMVLSSGDVASLGSPDVSQIPADVVHKPSTLDRLSDYPIGQATEMLSTYTKFLFVRHPFERLLSAYRNKLEQRHDSSRYFQSRFGRRIVRRYRANATERSLQNGDDVTFAEFASFVADTRDTVFNEHWAPIDRLCQPCAINYDFIGKHESLFHDSDYLLKHVVGIADIKFPKGPDSNTSTQLVKYFTSLDHNTILRLYSIFELDFKLFNYNLQNILGYEVG